MRTPSGRRRLAAASAICLATTFTAQHVVAADSLSGTRGELSEKSHVVDVTCDRGRARLVVRRTVHNAQARADQAVFFLDMPSGAVATGLRTLGTVDGRPHWFTGDLLEAEAAAAKYRELTGIGGAYPKDPALLSWRHQSLLELQVFPVPGGQPKTVEYTLDLPSSYRDGRWRLELPPLGTEKLPATVVVRAARPGDRLFAGAADGGGASERRVRDGAAVEWPKDGALELSLAPGAQAPLDGALASVPFGTARNLVHWHLEAAAPIERAPSGAFVVVVLDGSRSVSADEAALQRAAARAYLSHLPGARVEVLTFDRLVHRRHGAFVSVADAVTGLSGGDVARANGSRFEEALSEADGLLATAPFGAPRRILALTDLRTREALDPTRVRSPSSGAVLHIAVVDSGSPALARDDDDGWAKPARGTGGVLWRATASLDAGDAADMRRVYEEWARPMRIDHVKLVAAGIDPSGLSVGETLDEGQGLEELRIEVRGVPRVTLSGELWSRPIVRQLAADRAEGDFWSAAVFGSHLQGGLTEPEMMTLAQRGHAVSPVTSYLAVEPGVRPSTEGLEASGIGEGGGGRGEGIGLGSIGVFGRGSGTGFDHEAALRAALAPAWRACGGKPGDATVDVETTLDEVVDVPRVVVATDDQRACLAEAVWRLTLPPAFASEHETFTVAL